MKFKAFLIDVILIFSSFLSFAQFKISGSVIGDKEVNLKLDVPVIYDLDPLNAKEIAVESNGNFSVNIPLTDRRFIALHLDNDQILLFVQPHEDLFLVINSNNRTIADFKGSLADENYLLQAIGFNKTPFFMEQQGGKYNYASTTAEEIQGMVVKPWFKEREERLLRITQSSISQANKELFKNEVRFHALASLTDFTGSIVRWRKSEWRNFQLALYDTVSPNLEEQYHGLQYYKFIDRYISYMQSKALDQYLKDTTISRLLFFNLSLDSIMRLAKVNGENYVAWLSVKQNVSRATAERYLAQQILNSYRYKDLKSMKILMVDFEAYFADSRYLPHLRTCIAKLDEKLMANKRNASIKFFNEGNHIKSIYEIIKRYRGKVVYLAIWGTWCGPCKVELSYTSQLKDKFNNKDIVFIYLDMDDDDKEDEWRNFVWISNLQGLHIRMNNEHIQRIWAELLPTGDGLRGLYPSYFIFDKNGILIKEKAKRPSDQQLLYTQLEKHL